MDTVLGLIAFVVFIPAVIALAAAMTWVVVRVSPGTKDAHEDAKKAARS